MGHNHRQGPDKEYAELLNRLRFKSKTDELSDEDAQLLNDRVRDPPKGINVTKIFGKNVNVNEENIKRLNKLEGKMFKCVELEHNHRQGPDREYAELLNRLRFKSKT